MPSGNLSSTSDQITILETSIIDAQTKLRSDSRNVKIYYLLSGISTVFLVLHYSQLLPLALGVLITVWILAIVLLLAAFGTDLDKVKSEIDKFEAVKRIHLGFPSSAHDKPEYFDSLVKINVENLAAYYTLVKTHTSQSFKVSLLVSIAGFALITAGLIIGFKVNEGAIGYIATGAGIIVEFISGVLFYLYNKTVRQLKEYHDSLIDVQNILLSFKLIENTTDEKAKAEMVTKMLEYLVQKK